MFDHEFGDCLHAEEAGVEVVEDEIEGDHEEEDTTSDDTKEFVYFLVVSNVLYLIISAEEFCFGRSIDGIAFGNGLTLDDTLKTGKLFVLIVFPRQNVTIKGGTPENEFSSDIRTDCMGGIPLTRGDAEDLILKLS